MSFLSFGFMNFLTIEEIFEYLDIIETRNVPVSPQIKGVSTDTRTIQEGEIFVALKGDNFDGHNFLDDAFNKGASLAVVNKDWANQKTNTKFPIITVEDTLFALGELANLYRSKFDIPIVAVGGSNGKTTTKDFVAHILSQKFKVLKTEGNHNNQIGVPLTLFKLNSSIEVAVIEIGTNQFGEIPRLCEILEPTHGVITNIGKEHLEAFIDLDGVEMEETSLYGYLLKHGGISFVNTDDPRLDKYVKLLENRFTYGRNPDNNLIYSIEYNEKLFPKITFEYGGKKFSAVLNNPGFSVALASVPAVAVGLSFGLTIEEILEGLQSFKLPEHKDYGRMLVKSVGNYTLINDTYNANPSSMNLALETLRMLTTSGKKIAVLGDMLELGETSQDEHFEIINKARSICDEVFIYGIEMKKAFEKLSNTENVHFFENKVDISKELISKLTGEDIILFKASRGMRCEEVLNDFINKLNK